MGQKHLLIWIHGIGTHGKSWADRSLDILTRASHDYPLLKERGLADVRHVQISYSAIISDVIRRWQGDSAGAIKPWQQDQKITASELAVVSDVMAWLAGADADGKFFWSHVADVLLYRYVGHYGQQVRLEAIERVAKAMQDFIADNERSSYSVIAHSMGTSVAHDALNLLAQRGWAGRRSGFAPTTPGGRFQSLFMIANVSRLLQQDSDGGIDMRVYDSVVRPGEVDDPASNCFNYWNVQHEYDPIPYPKRFAPKGWGERYHPISVRHVHDWDVHAIEHYLLHPRVHIPILRAITSYGYIPVTEEIAALDRFEQRQFGGRFKVVEDVKDHLAALLGRRTKIDAENLTPVDKLRYLTGSVATLKGHA